MSASHCLLIVFFTTKMTFLTNQTPSLHESRISRIVLFLHCLTEQIELNSRGIVAFYLVGGKIPSSQMVIFCQFFFHFFGFELIQQQLCCESTLLFQHLFSLHRYLLYPLDELTSKMTFLSLLIPIWSPVFFPLESAHSTPPNMGCIHSRGCSLVHVMGGRRCAKTKISKTMTTNNNKCLILVVILSSQPTHNHNQVCYNSQ